LSVSAQDNRPEKIKSVKTVRGKFIRFLVGDFIHPETRKSNGKRQNFYLDSYDLQYFLVVNRGKTMTFTYDVVDVPKDSERIIITRLKSAKIGNLTFEKWWRDLRKRYTEEQIKKKYDPLVEKYTEY
jgi:hypothetical protein